MRWGDYIIETNEKQNKEIVCSLQPRSLWGLSDKTHFNPLEGQNSDTLHRKTEQRWENTTFLLLDEDVGKWIDES